MGNPTREHDSGDTGISGQVRGIVGEILEVEPGSINPGAQLVEDLGMDSMKALEILAAVEKRFRIRIPEESLPKMTTLDRIVSIAEKHVRG